MESFASETAVEGGSVILHLTFTCLEEGAQKKWQVPGLSFSTIYSVSCLCLHFLLKSSWQIQWASVRQELWVTKGCSQKFHMFFLQTISKFISYLKIIIFMFQFCILIGCSFRLQIIHKMKASFFFCPTLFDLFFFLLFLFLQILCRF